MGIIKSIVDFIYGTNRVKRKYLRNHPHEKVYASDGTKAIITKGDQDIQRGFNWVIAKRAIILLTDQRIKCGKWNILLENIKNAELIKFHRGQVLKIETNEQVNYQFGMSPNPEWENQSVLPLSIKKTSLKYSWYSIIVRLLLVAYIIYQIITGNLF